MRADTPEAVLSTPVSADGLTPDISQDMLGSASKGAYWMIAATSMLASEGSNTYYPHNVADDNGETVWAEGVSGNGIGQSITLSTSTPQLVYGVHLVGGILKTSSRGDLYYRNSRPRQVTILWEGGQGVLSLDDMRGYWQGVSFGSPIRTSYVTIRIDAVYPGSVYEDCCIAEVRLG